MFKHTLGVIDKTKSDIKRAVFIVQLCLYSLIVAIPLYRMITQENYLLNLPLFLISLACLILFIVANARKDIRFKRLLRIARKCRRKLNLAILLLTLIISLSGILFIGSSLLLMTIFILSLIGWLTALIFKLIAKFIEVRLEMLGEAIRMDLTPITNPVINATNFVREKLGKDPIEQTEPKHKKQLIKFAADYSEKIKARREERRLMKK